MPDSDVKHDNGCGKDMPNCQTAYSMGKRGKISCTHLFGSQNASVKALAKAASPTRGVAYA